MRVFACPMVVTSRCIKFDHCRYDKNMLGSEIVHRTKDKIDFLTVCMEADRGLGIPRDPVGIAQSEDGMKRLIQPSKQRDVTYLAEEFSRSFMDTLETVKGFILERSPDLLDVGITDWCGWREMSSS